MWRMHTHGHRGCRVRLLTLLLPVGAAAGELGHITLIGEKIHFGSQFGRLKPWWASSIAMGRDDA